MTDLVEARFDLAIRAVVPPDSSLIVRRLAEWRHTLCCAPRYLENHPAPARLADLGTHSCLRYAYYPFGDEWRFIDRDGKAAAVRVSGNFVTSSAVILRAVLLSGGGLALAAPFVAEEELRAGTLVSLLPGQLRSQSTQSTRTGATWRQRSVPLSICRLSDSLSISAGWTPRLEGIAGDEKVIITSPAATVRGRRCS